MQYHTENVHQLSFKKRIGVCKYYRQGRCTRQECSFRHPESLAMKPHLQQYTPACTRGPNCVFFANNRCHYFHPGVGVQMPRVTENKHHMRQSQFNQQPARGQQQASIQPARPRGKGQGQPGPSRGQQEAQIARKRCHFQDRCWNQDSCPFTHEDFGMKNDFLENF